MGGSPTSVESLDETIEHTNICTNIYIYMYVYLNICTSCGYISSAEGARWDNGACAQNSKPPSHLSWWRASGHQHTYLFSHECTYMHMYLNIYRVLNTADLFHISVDDEHPYISMYIHIYMKMYIYLHIYMYAYTYIYMYVYINFYMYVSAYICMYMFICIHK